MKKFTLIALAAVLLTLGSAQAVLETIDGRDWEVILDGTGGSSYSVGADSLTLTGNWSLWDHAYTSISVDVGHIIEFDLEQTGDGVAWIDDAGWYMMDNMTNWNTAQRGIYTTNIDWYWNHSTNEWFEFSAGTGNIVHVLIEFPTATDYLLTMDNGEQTLVLDRPIGGGLAPSGIGVFVMATWNTQQSTTVSDFYAGPSPYAWGPYPALGADGIDPDDDLAWNAPTAYTAQGYELYFRADDPNWIDQPRNIVNGASVATTETDPVTYALDTLDYGRTYYWRVDSIEPNDPAPIMHEGNVWSFTIIGAAPVIEIFDNGLTSLDLLDADLAAVVTDADNNMASVSWELLTGDYRYPAGAVASVTDTTSDLYAPTATFTTDTAGYYLVKLTATDGDAGTAEAIAEVRVLETACAAAQASGNWAGFDPFDSDIDCDIDMVDLAAFGAKWLSDIALAGQETWVGAVTSVPGYGIPNGGFELGTLDYWASAAWGAGTIIDAPADVYEGTYACALSGSDGVTMDALYVSEGSYSLTWWYKGDYNLLSVGFDGNMSTAAFVFTYPEDFDWTMSPGTVPDYTQFTLEFDVTSAGVIAPYVWGDTGSAFVDDFRLSKN